MSGDSHILILNHNGADLLAECLPSIVAAARQAPGQCRVSVIDNESTDDSLAVLTRGWPEVGVIPAPNRGLASFNAVACDLSEPVLLLLNNDVKLEPAAVGPLIAALQVNPDALFTAPRCWTFDGLAYEGMRTRVRSRFGLIQGLCRYPGYESRVDKPDLTASSGPILAVDRARFLALGGYDPVYFPGRIEDLDLGFRGWMAGWRGYYVPESVAYHKGFGSFGPAFGAKGCDQLATRNTLIFAWKNLGGARLVGHLAWLPIRTLFAVGSGRFGFVRALAGAIGMIRPVLAARRRWAVGLGDWVERQEAFFQRFAFDSGVNG